MPKYYCDYCDVFLTHDAPSVRRDHNTGWKHQAAIRTYFQTVCNQDKMARAVGEIIKQYEERREFVPVPVQVPDGSSASFNRPSGFPIMPMMIPGMPPLGGPLPLLRPGMPMAPGAPHVLQPDGSIHAPPPFPIVPGQMVPQLPLLPGQVPMFPPPFPMMFPGMPPGGPVPVPIHRPNPQAATAHQPYMPAMQPGSQLAVQQHK